MTAAFAAAGASAAVAFSSATSVSSPVETESKKPKLTYFDIPGRAFAIRAALRHAKIPFDDVRIAYPDLIKLRGPNGANKQVPLGQVPTLEFPNGEVVCQSVPILRWAARQSDLYPKDINDALLCDEIIESLAEARAKIPESKDDAERKKLREEFVAQTLPKYMDYLTRRLDGRGGPYLLGKSFTMADLVMARFVDGIIGKRYDHITKESLQKWPAVLKHFEAAQAHPVYAAEIRAEEEHQKKSKAGH